MNTAKKLDVDQHAHRENLFEQLAEVMSCMPVETCKISNDFYSLAHHALWVMRYVLWNTGSPKLALYALLHRTPEAYKAIALPVSDLHYLSGDLAGLPARMRSLVYRNLGLDEPSLAALNTIEDATVIALAIEAERLQGMLPLIDIPILAERIRCDQRSSAEIRQDIIEAYIEMQSCIAEVEKQA